MNTLLLMGHIQLEVMLCKIVGAMITPMGHMAANQFYLQV